MMFVCWNAPRCPFVLLVSLRMHESAFLLPEVNALLSISSPSAHRREPTLSFFVDPSLALLLLTLDIARPSPTPTLTTVSSRMCEARDANSNKPVVAVVLVVSRSKSSYLVTIKINFMFLLDAHIGNELRSIPFITIVENAHK